MKRKSYFVVCRRPRSLWGRLLRVLGGRDAQHDVISFHETRDEAVAQLQRTYSFIRSFGAELKYYYQLGCMWERSP